MARVQLALNVSDIDEAVAFYTDLFGTEPAKRKAGYANFAIADPPLKLVLIEGEGGGTLNHLGVEVDTSDEVEAAEARLSGSGLATTGGVITSAGLVLAATFSALWVIPLLFLAQLAFIVAAGVLIDTFIVRSLLVPGIVHDLGRRTWWPWARRIPQDS